MGSRRLVRMAAVFAFVSAPTWRASAQTSRDASTRSTETARASAVPRTAWGDPDLSGVWTTDNMRGVPRERPAEFGTRRYLTDEEYAKRVAQDEKTRTTEANRVGAFRNDVGTRTIRQTSQVVDPPDGKIPLNDEGKRRAATRSRGSFGEGPFNTFDDFTLYDRCITRGAVGSFGPAIYGNGSVIAQGPGVVALSYEMVHDTRIIPLDGRPHIAPTTLQYMGDATWSVGGRYVGR
jgi:hypothetical protein